MKYDNIFRISSRLPGALKGTVAEMGGKAFNLARMARIGLPVPPAFVLGTDHCRCRYLEPERSRRRLAGQLKEQLHWLQTVTGLVLGDPRKPLLVSVRSGAAVSMPGMMDSLLDIGLCDATVHGLLRLSGNPRLVWDSYCRLVRSFAEVVFGASPQPFAAALDGLLLRERLARPGELDYLSLAELSRTYLKLCSDLTGQAFPQNPLEQLELAVQAVFASWRSPRAVEYRRLNGIADDLFTAVTVQQMVFGNVGGASGAGVGFSRDPDSGAKRLYYDFLFNSQGEDVVSGRAGRSEADRLFTVLPEMRQKLEDLAAVLEKEFRDAQEFEFTVQDGVLYLLQSRTAKRTQWAALRIAVEQAGEGLIDRDEALARLEGIDLDSILLRKLSLQGSRLLTRGYPAGIGVVSGQLVLDPEAVRRFSAATGQAVVLVREEMATADIAGIALAAGLLSVRGNRTSHAALVARQLGIPAVCGCSGLRIDAERRVAVFGDHAVAEGETITLDANTGSVYAGAAEIVIDRPTQWLDEIRKWSRSARSAGA